MKSVNPYLNFNGNAEQAFTFYKSVFGGEFLSLVRLKDMQSTYQVPEDARNMIAHIALPIGKNTVLMASDNPDSGDTSESGGNGYYLHIEAESEAEADRLFEALSAGGKVEMAPQQTEWARKFGICADRFGVRWMIDYTGEVRFS